MSNPFTPDIRLQQLALTQSEVCVRQIASKFGGQADYSDAAVVAREAALNMLRLHIPIGKPSQQQIAGFASIFGSYLGETYCRNHGGIWGTQDGGVALRTGS